MDAPTDQRSLKELYARRFGPKERAEKNALWKVLCQSFLQRYVSESDVVVDLGAGYCEFINNIRCGRKIAVDLNEDTRQYAARDVTVILEPADAVRPGGRLLVVQPNIRYAYKEYWDYFDHHLPLSHLSLAEVLELEGFAIEEVRARFLPYTVKSRFPKSGLLVRLYLRLRPLQMLLGKQMFLVASKP